MDRNVYYKYLLIIGAIWNLVLSLPLLIGSFFGASEYLGLNLMYYQGFLIAVALFGLGYLIVGLDLDNNHLVIILGVIGKILVFIFFLIYYLMGYLPLYQMLAGVGDLVFSVFFIEFLIKYKKV